MLSFFLCREDVGETPPALGLYMKMFWTHVNTSYKYSTVFWDKTIFIFFRGSMFLFAALSRPLETLRVKTSNKHGNAFIWTINIHPEEFCFSFRNIPFLYSFQWENQFLYLIFGIICIVKSFTRLTHSKKSHVCLHNIPLLIHKRLSFSLLISLHVETLSLVKHIKLKWLWQASLSV